MFRGFDIRPEERVILTARIRQRVKEMLPVGWQIRQVVEVPCSDTGCPLRITRVDVTDPAGQEQSWSLHAPLSLVTAKEVAQLLEKHVPAPSTHPKGK
jgi:hypothetical protein